MFIANPLAWLSALAGWVVVIAIGALVMPLAGCDQGHAESEPVVEPTPLVVYIDTLPDALATMSYQTFTLAFYEDGQLPPALTDDGTCIIHAAPWNGTTDDGWGEHVGQSAYDCITGRAEFGEVYGNPQTREFWVRPYNGHCFAEWMGGCTVYSNRTVDVQAWFWVYNWDVESYSAEYEQHTAGTFGHEIAHMVYGDFHGKSCPLQPTPPPRR